MDLQDLKDNEGLIRILLLQALYYDLVLVKIIYRQWIYRI